MKLEGENGSSGMDIDGVGNPIEFEPQKNRD